jgi:hypothetical protein
MILPAIQPMFEKHLSGADWTGQQSSMPGGHVTRPSDAPLGSTLAASARSDTRDVPFAHPERSRCHSDQVNEVVEGLKECQAGSSVAHARKAFETALSDEFATVQREGEDDVNKAGAEAMRRVLVAVRNGLVLPPE